MSGYEVGIDWGCACSWVVRYLWEFDPNTMSFGLVVEQETEFVKCDKHKDLDQSGERRSDA